MSTAIPVDPDAAVARLREWVGEQDVDNTTWTRDRLLEVLGRHTDLEGAAGETWRLKASEAANLVDMREGGSDRKLSQLRTGATAMAEFYETRSDENVVLPEGTTGITTTRAIERA